MVEEAEEDGVVEEEEEVDKILLVRTSYDGQEKQPNVSR